MLSPNYKLKIGTETIEPPISTEVVSVGVTLDTSVLADSFNITLKRSHRTEKFKEGDEVHIHVL